MVTVVLNLMLEIIITGSKLKLTKRRQKFGDVKLIMILMLMTQMRKLIEEENSQKVEVEATLMVNLIFPPTALCKLKEPCIQLLEMMITQDY
jgi:hypothetical protein